MSLRTQTLDYIQYREKVLQLKLKKKVDKLLNSGFSIREINQIKSIINLRWEYRNVKSLIKEWEDVW